MERYLETLTRKRTTEDGILQGKPISIWLPSESEIVSSTGDLKKKIDKVIKTQVDITDPKAYKDLIEQLKDIKRCVRTGSYIEMTKDSWIKWGYVYTADEIRDYEYDERADMNRGGWTYTSYTNPLGPVFQLVAGIPEYAEYDENKQLNVGFDLRKLVNPIYGDSDAGNVDRRMERVAELNALMDLYSQSNLSGEAIAKTFAEMQPNLTVFATQALDCVTLKPIGEYSIAELKEQARELRTKCNKQSRRNSGLFGSELYNTRCELTAVEDDINGAIYAETNHKVYTLSNRIHDVVSQKTK